MRWKGNNDMWNVRLRKCKFFDNRRKYEIPNTYVVDSVRIEFNQRPSMTFISTTSCNTRVRS